MYTTVLLDLGNVVLGIDFRRVFAHWATAADVPADRFLSRWQMDSAYNAHETGHLDFTGYSQHLSTLFDVTLSDNDWHTGWNSIWTEPFHDVIDLLPDISERYQLAAFSNTNATHATGFNERFPSALQSFQRVFLSHEIGRRKPDVESFSWVCGEMGTTPGDVLFIDDNQENVIGARQAGMHARHVSSQQEVADILSGLLD